MAYLFLCSCGIDSGTCTNCGSMTVTPEHCRALAAANALVEQLREECTDRHLASHGAGQENGYLAALQDVFAAEVPHVPFKEAEGMVERARLAVELAEAYVLADAEDGEAHLERLYAAAAAWRARGDGGRR